ncbi:hypothetical protein AB0M29_05065 [Streptomyces sp. NPDC051976]|uniref:hypothetical protein n=1 Tax=Streptomyces sp. NPDC051976 TaxID=3154947 RepID=UPI003448F865
MSHHQHTVPPQPPALEGRTRGAAARTTALIGSVAVLAALAVSGCGSSDAGGVAHLTDAGPHKLSVPATLVDGTYTKGSDSDPAPQEVIKEVESWGGHDLKDVSATYQKGKGLTARILTYTGFYGTFDDPEKAVDEWFALLARTTSGDHQYVGRPEELKPSGFTIGVMKCQQVRIDDVVVQTDAVCVWGDGSTLALVTSHPPRLGDASATVPTSLHDAAELAATVREEVRVKV